MTAEAWYFSVRMRAECDGHHVGGAERLVETSDWTTALDALSQRALGYPPEASVFVVSEPVLASEVAEARVLPVRTAATDGVESSRRTARSLLVELGVSSEAADLALSLLERGPGHAGNAMRGGVVMHASSGRRLEPDQARGIRATRMDYSTSCRRQLNHWLTERQLTSPRVIEAIAVASKAAWSGALAELCWSDDPHYVAGYVASPASGYVRMDRLKPPGHPRGGRVFFLREPEELDSFCWRMERSALLLTDAPWLPRAGSSCQEPSH